MMAEEALPFLRVGARKPLPSGAAKPLAPTAPSWKLWAAAEEAVPAASSR